MKTAAIICEYNPLHNGHLYHIKTTRELTGCDFLVCLMSGNFVQRGEAAILDKYTRCRAALNAGADLVIELPCIFAVANAEIFAKGSLHILNSLGFVDFLSFGSESGDCTELTKFAEQLISTESDEIKLKLTELQKQGYSYPKALAESYGTVFGKQSAKLFSPNNILALEYIKAILSSNSTIKPFTIKRKGGEHSSLKLDTFASSTAIRTAIRQNTDITALNLPPFSLDESIIKNINFDKRDSLYYALLRQKLMSTDVESLNELYDYSEGIEYRIKKCAAECLSLDEFYQKVKSKRYTLSKIKRLSFYALLDLKKEVPANALNTSSYFNILGIKNTAKTLLTTLPAGSIVKAKDADNLSISQKNILDYDIKAQIIYSIITNSEINGNFQNGLITV